MARYFQALGGSVDVTGHPINDIVTQGDTVVATGSVTFRVGATGKAGSSSWVYIFKLANGQVHSFDQFNDTGLAEAAVVLRCRYSNRPGLIGQLRSLASGFGKPA